MNESAEPKQAHKRRIIMVNKPLQIKVAAITLLLFLLAAFSVWWETYTAFSKLSGSGVFDESSANLMLMVSQLSKTIFIKVAIFLGLVWVLAIALSHYIAGPLFRFEATLKALQNGDLTQRVKLRKFDQLKNLERELNNTLEFLQNSANSDRGKVEEIKRALENLRAKVDPGTAERLAGISRSIDEIGKHFKQ